MNCGCILIKGTYPEWITRIEMCHLHETAPDLLEALKELCDMVDGLFSGDYHAFDSFTTQPARVAIAKAERREP